MTLGSSFHFYGARFSHLHYGQGRYQWCLESNTHRTQVSNEGDQVMIQSDLRLEITEGDQGDSPVQLQGSMCQSLHSWWYEASARSGKHLSFNTHKGTGRRLLSPGQFAGHSQLLSASGRLGALQGPDLGLGLALVLCPGCWLLSHGS